MDIKEGIDKELSCYGSTLLALQASGLNSAEETHKLKVESVDQILSLIRPPEVKTVKEIQGRIEHYLVLYRSGEYNKRQTAEKIYQLFKVKLPENPYEHIMKEMSKPPCLLTCKACLWDEALQQVKELNEVKE